MTVERQKHNQAGESGFYHFYGVVEDRKDVEKKMGRVRVRIFGDHTESLSELPTDDLPWAQVMLAVTDTPNQSHNLWDGTLVFGYYADGVEKQLPVIIGQMGKNGDTTLDPEGAKSEGFMDQRGSKDCSTTTGKTDASVGINTSPVANEGKYGASTQKKIRIETLHKIKPSGAILFDYEEPPDEYSASYPFNRARETESGHVVEYDDTPGNERINIFHRTGARVEMLKDGSVIVKAVKDKHDVTNGDKTESVNGDLKNNVDGMKESQISGTYTLLVAGGDLTVEVAAGNLNLTVNGNVNQTVSGNYNAAIGGSYNIAASTFSVKAGSINLN